MPSADFDVDECLPKPGELIQIHQRLMQMGLFNAANELEKSAAACAEDFRIADSALKGRGQDIADWRTAEDVNRLKRFVLRLEEFVQHLKESRVSRLEALDREFQARKGSIQP